MPRVRWGLAFAVGAGILTLTAVAAELRWEAGPSYRSAPLAIPAAGKPGFTRVSPDVSGVSFANLLATERGITNRNLLSGSGLALGDVDGDGWCDLYFCGLDGSNVLYRNLGSFRFTNITEQAGVACAGQDSTGTVFADIDGDGDLDLLVHSLGNGVRVFTNDGRGRFAEATDRAGLRSTIGGMSLALADVDGDGDLDLYVVNYRTTTVMDQPKTTFTVRPVNGEPVVALVNGVPTTEPHLTNRFVFTPGGSVLELGEPDSLYLNDGRGRFRPVSWTDGSFLDEDGRPLPDAPRDWGLSVQMRDVNEDGAPDIYVANDLFTPDRFWINDGRGRFRAIDRLALRTTSVFSMGVDFGDLNRDGHVDFMLVDMLARGHKDRHTQVSQNKPAPTPIGVIDDRPQVWRNTLLLNRGDGTFAEVSFYAGVEASNWSWMPLFLDVDLDGFEDIIIPNGQMRDFQNVDMQRRIEEARAARQLTADDIMKMVKLFPDFSTPSTVFRNRGDLTFEEMNGRWGLTERGVAQGMACADLDNDGDLDLVVNKLDEPAGIYRNDGTEPRLAIRLKGNPPNVQGIGAKLVVKGGPVEQSQEIICGGRYLSGADPLRVFATGRADAKLTIEVTWRSGRRSVIAAAGANRLYEIDEAGAEPPAAAPKPEPKAWFADVSDRLNHQHHEDAFDDFARQPLLAHRLSQLGPGLAWHDFDGDGWDDLIVGTGRGGVPGVFRNDTQGGFTPLAEPFVTRPAGRDLTAVVGVGSTLFVGASNYEDGRTNGGCLRIYDLNRKVSGDSVLGELSSAGPLALADFDGDGALDLFIGGRVVPGHYPEAATSLLLRNEGGRFVARQRLTSFGLASGAVFTDLDNDGDPDLGVACEWGPVRLLRNDAGQFSDWNPSIKWQRPPADAPSKLGGLLGWWTSITTGDFDGDGRQDLVVGNWGTNHKFQRDLSYRHPRALYYGDLDESGTVDLIEAVFSPEFNAEVPERGYLAAMEAMPFLRETIETFEAYGTNTLAAIYGDRFQRASRVEVNTLTSLLLLNRGEHFEARPLPAEAQFSPAFGLCVGDFDGDGAEDLFVAQNFFATTVEYTRYDGGRSVLLRGDGKGNFTAVPGQESGLRIYGEQRGAAAADFDHDGRLDLAVTQNGNVTKLYRNLAGRPGLRVRLQGPAGNPAAVGAVLRLRFGERLGPARELRAGAGYWSQDSPNAVLATPSAPTALEIRWPEGRVTSTPLPAEARSVTVDAQGKIVGP